MELVTAGLAAERLGVSEHYIRFLIDAGRLPARSIDRFTVVKWDDVQRLGLPMVQKNDDVDALYVDLGGEG